MARLTWTAPARRDMRAIHRYIAQDSPSAAGAMVERLRQEAGRLTRFPEIGRAVPEYHGSGIREVIVAPYRLLYRHDAARDRVQVLAVIHGSRQLPEAP